MYSNWPNCANRLFADYITSPDSALGFTLHFNNIVVLVLRRAFDSHGYCSDMKTTNTKINHWTIVCNRIRFPYNNKEGASDIHKTKFRVWYSVQLTMVGNRSTTSAAHIYNKLRRYVCVHYACSFTMGRLIELSCLCSCKVSWLSW